MSLFHGTRQWVYTRAVGGTYQRLHRWSGRALIGLLFVVPWLSVGGSPLVRIDLPARRLDLLGRVFTASDGYLLVLAALLAAFGLLFLGSALLGRVWCGYLCPQTVFLEEWVRRVELWTEGDATARWRRDAGPWTAQRFGRKAVKVALLGGLAVALAFTLQSYFAGARAMWTLQAGPVDYALAGLLTVGLLADWLWFREQLCIYLCPYARFQSALTDDHSLTVAYDVKAGIGRGRSAAESGQCIDCKACVQVCPMGIDIRDGFQLECIQCARCIDACTDVLGKLGRPTLVRYTTLAAEQGTPTRIVRPRTLIYGALVSGLAAVLIGAVALHNPIEVSLNRTPGTLFQVADDGWVRNTYLLRVVNNDPRQAHAFAIEVDGLPEAAVMVPELRLEAREDRTVPLVVSLPADQAARTRAFSVTVRSERDTRTLSTTFKGPGGEG